MKADATAEKRPVYQSVSRVCDILGKATDKYQGGVQVIVVLFAKVLVVFVRFFLESFVETRSSVLLQVIPQPVDEAT
jgi:hypothetical protein